MEFLTTEGMIFVIFAWGFVLGMAGWSLYKVLRTGTDLAEDDE